METKNKKFYNCVYDEIFKEYSIKNNIVENFKNFIKLLESKNIDQFTLAQEEINSFISFNEKAWNLIKCEVNTISNIHKEVKKYEISLVIQNSENKKSILITKTFYKEIRRYYYQQEYYLCFIEESLKRKFLEIQKIHQFYIIQIINGVEKKIRPDIFFNLFIPEFIIQVNYKFLDIKLEEIKTDDIYHMPAIIKAKDLNKKLGLYIDLTEEDFNNFIYYHTKERMNFITSLKRLFDYQNYIGLCGPFGTGKTITLLKFVINSQLDRIFYINLWTIENTSLEELKILFKYESIKLFGRNFFNEDEMKIYGSNNENIYEEIIKKIEDFDDKKKIYLLLGDIISLLNKTFFLGNYYIIIDQYSSKYDENNESIKNLLKTIKYMDKIFIIISSSMNNYDIKKNFADSLDHSYLFAMKNFSLDFKIKYYYIGCFIRLNTLEDYDNYIKEKTPLFRKRLNSLGNIPLFYYELNKIANKDDKIEQYMEEEKYKIIGEINTFYDKNLKNDDICKFFDILKILGIVDQKEIYLIDELAENILNLPLKFLEIKKEIISLKALKIFAYASKNLKLMKKFDEIEKENGNKTIDKIIGYEEDLNNFTQFINEDDYCSNYLKTISIKKQNQYSKSMKNLDYKITVYYLDHLFPFMDDILSNMAYKLLVKTSQFLFNYLPGQTQGGFLEYIINEYIKKNKYFINFHLTNFEEIECLVPNYFFIKNYSSRLKETKKTFKEIKALTANIKIDLDKKNTFIKQSQFTGKYYDCCLLIFNPSTGKYILYLFQISKKKIESNRYYREEHKIIMNRVKKILEQKYSIQIEEGHFSYILIEEDKDENTIKFCKENSLKYHLFSIKEVKFIDQSLNLDENSLITKTFPIHSSFSILRKQTIKDVIDGVIKTKKFAAKIEENINIRDIPDKIKMKFKNSFLPKDKFNKSENNNFWMIYESNEEPFDVNPNFCFWFNNEELSIKYRDKNFEEYDLKFDDLYKNDKLSVFKYTLICSKFKIKYKNELP